MVIEYGPRTKSYKSLKLSMKYDIDKLNTKYSCVLVHAWF